MNPWFAVATLIIGAVYLLATVALNYFKHDGVGWWLRKCCWSNTTDGRLPDTPDGRTEEKRSLLEIQLSPQFFVKSTVEERKVYTPRVGYLPASIQNGAWIKMRLPSVVRGQLIQFNIIDSKRPLGVLPVSKMDDPVQDPFLDRGQFVATSAYEKVSNRAYSRNLKAPLYSPLPPTGEDIVWQTWVPVSENADFIEIQIWYPSQVLNPAADDRGYLYQLELDTEGKTKTDGLSTSQLEVKKPTVMMR